MGSQDGTIGILEVLKHLPSARFFKAHDNSNRDTAKRQGVRSLAWNSLGDRLASSGWDSLVKIWDPSSGTELVRMEAHNGWVMGVAWSPSGKELASASSDTLVRVLNAATGKKLQTMRGHSDFVDAVVWSPDGTRLASAGFDNSVRIWDPQTGEETLSLRGNSGMFHDISWHPDGARIAAASSDGQIWIWDATRGFERDTTNRALPYINRQLTAGTVRSEDLYSFVESYVRAGKFREALDLAKGDPASLRKLARLFQKNGDTTMADAARAKALTLLQMQFVAEPFSENIVLALADLVLDFRVTPDQEPKRVATIEMADPWADWLRLIISSVINPPWTGCSGSDLLLQSESASSMRSSRIGRGRSSTLRSALQSNRITALQRTNSSMPTCMRGAGIMRLPSFQPSLVKTPEIPFRL